MSACKVTNVTILNFGSKKTGVMQHNMTSVSF